MRPTDDASTEPRQTCPGGSPGALRPPLGCRKEVCPRIRPQRARNGPDRLQASGDIVVEVRHDSQLCPMGRSQSIRGFDSTRIDEGFTTPARRRAGCGQARWFLERMGKSALPVARIVASTGRRPTRTGVAWPRDRGCCELGKTPNRIPRPIYGARSLMNEEWFLYIRPLTLNTLAANWCAACLGAIMYGAFRFTTACDAVVVSLMHIRFSCSRRQVVV